jgi:hypothetical protein
VLPHFLAGPLKLEDTRHHPLKALEALPRRQQQSFSQQRAINILFVDFDHRVDTTRSGFLMVLHGLLFPVCGSQHDFVLRSILLVRGREQRTGDAFTPLRLNSTATDGSPFYGDLRWIGAFLPMLDREP